MSKIFPLSRFIAAAGGLLLSALAIPSSATEGDWQYRLSPLFLWAQSISGSSSLNGQSSDLDLDFQDDILENLDAAFAFHFEAQRDNLTLFAEYQTSTIKPGAGGQVGPVPVRLDVDFDETIAEFGAGWAFHQDDRSRWELLGGARYTDHELEADITVAGPLPGDRSRRIEGGDDWWHALVGVRVFESLSERWTFVGRGDLGYGGSDNSAFNFTFLFDYRFRDWGSVFIGGRYMDYDYDSNSYGFDAAKRGPVAGFMLHW